MLATLTTGGDCVGPEAATERLAVCQDCKRRVGYHCPVVHCGCQLGTFAVYAANDCPLGKWPTADIGR